MGWAVDGALKDATVEGTHTEADPAPIDTLKPVLSINFTLNIHFVRDRKQTAIP